MHWEVVCPSNSNLLNWVEVSKLDLLPSRCIFHANEFTLVSVSVALSFELSLSSIREMPPFFQCQDFPNSGYPELCALIGSDIEYTKINYFFKGCWTILQTSLFIGFLSIICDLHRLKHLCLLVLEFFKIDLILLNSERELYIYYCFVNKVCWIFP